MVHSLRDKQVATEPLSPVPWAAAPIYCVYYEVGRLRAARACSIEPLQSSIDLEAAAWPREAFLGTVLRTEQKRSEHRTSSGVRRWDGSREKREVLQATAVRDVRFEQRCGVIRAGV